MANSSFPYLNVAKKHDVPYALILFAVDEFLDKARRFVPDPREAGVMLVPYQLRKWLTYDEGAETSLHWFYDTIEAYKAEQSRRGS